MHTDVVMMKKYTASEGKVFDWADARYTLAYDKDGLVIPGERVREHLYTKTIYMAGNDKIENYVEVDDPTLNQE